MSTKADQLRDWFDAPVRWREPEVTFDELRALVEAALKEEREAGRREGRKQMLNEALKARDASQSVIGALQVLVWKDEGKS